jgi:hypothetical protein
MAQIAIVGYDFTFFILMLAGMTPETAIGFPMTDMIEIFGAGCIHFRKGIFLKFHLDSGDGFFNQFLLPVVNLGMLILIICIDAVSDFHQGCIRRSILIGEYLHRSFFNE